MSDARKVRIDTTPVPSLEEVTRAIHDIMRRFAALRKLRLVALHTELMRRRDLAECAASQDDDNVT